MPYLRHDNIETYYETLGSGHPFILLHGLGNSMQQVRAMYRPVENIQYIFMDQRGHGQSTSDGDYCFDALVNDVIALADHLGIKAFAIGGISMGAAVSLATYFRYPERVKGLFLIRNAWAGQPMNDRNRNLFEALAKGLSLNSREYLLNSEAYRIAEKEAPESAASMFQFYDDPVSVKYWQKFAAVPKQKPFESLDDLKKISVPVTVLANTYDDIHPFEFGVLIHKAIPQSDFYPIACKALNKDQYHQDIG
ncbi:MAG: alpha/beta hydrolase, partial [Erysipelotrichaceae bacterium]|nr:alpha/beta hydrolase [Erysipelotrichaceae bacterium]